MTNSDQLDPDDPEEYDPMAMSRDYHDAPFIIPGLRVRRVSPSTRRHPRRPADQLVGPVLAGSISTDPLKPLKTAGTDRQISGVLRQSDRNAGVLRQKALPADDQVADLGHPRKVATPPAGAEMPLKGVEESGCPDTRTDPLRQKSKGDLRGFRRSGDLDPDAGCV